MFAMSFEVWFEMNISGKDYCEVESDLYLVEVKPGMVRQVKITTTSAVFGDGHVGTIVISSEWADV